jgi:hypothetical protein
LKLIFVSRIAFDCDECWTGLSTIGDGAKVVQQSEIVPLFHLGQIAHFSAERFGNLAREWHSVTLAVGRVHFSCKKLLQWH